MAWRSRFRWPLRASALFDIQARHLQNQLRFIAELDDDERDVVLLGRVATLGALIEAAYGIQAEGGAPYLYGVPELEVLRGTKKATDIDIPTTGSHVLSDAIRHRRLRQAVRAASWSSAGTLLKNLVAPDAMALSHNSLLRDYIKRHAASVGYRHGAAYLSDLVAAHGGAPLGVDSQALSARYLDAVIAFDDLSPEIAERLKRLLQPRFVSAFRKAAETLGALRAAPKLPKNVWTGTGAAHPNRALGIEVIRRGGEARRFDHGGTSVISGAYAAFATNELAVSNIVVMPTERAAQGEMPRQAASQVASYRKTALIGHDGDPGLDIGAAAYRNGVTRGAKRRVLYVATAFYGFHQTSTPAFPGIPYFEWQMRLLEALSAMPISLACKPHPEGVLRARRQPAEGLAPIIGGRFEDAVADADVLVMDVAASTTFSVALTTDRPIVFFDFGLLPFGADIQAEIERRCRILTPTYDDANRPCFDDAELREAVCGGADKADPAFFRQLFLANAV